MTKFKEIIATLKQTDKEKAELWEEVIDTIVHKLKFLSKDAIPTVAIIDQKNLFHPLDSSLLQEKVKISGGEYSTNLNKDTEVIIVLQKDDSLYSLLPDFIEQHNDTKAIHNNNIFVINNNTFNTSDESYLLDVEILAEIIQSKYFVFGYNGINWVKFNLN